MSNYSWNNPAGGLFDDAGNWSPDTAYPGPGDTATFAIPDSFIVSGDGTAEIIQISDNATFTGDIEVMGPPPNDFTAFLVSDGTAEFDGGALLSLQEVQVGDRNGDGLLAFLDGGSGTFYATDSATALDIGYDDTNHVDSGTVTVDGPTTTLTLYGGAYVGVFSPGTLAITDYALVQVLVSTASYDTFEVGSGTGSSGVVDVDTGGTLSVDENSFIGNTGAGTVSFNNSASGYFSAAVAVGDLAAGLISFAGAATGVITGISATAAALYLGGSGGTLTADGGGTSLTTDEGVVVGYNGIGLVELTNGATLALNPMLNTDSFASTYLGYGAGDKGTVTVASGATLTIGAVAYIGDAGNGLLHVSGGATGLFSDYTVVGFQSGGTGEVIFDSGATGTFDGVDPYDDNAPAASVYLGSDAGAAGTMTIDGPTTSVTADQGIFVGFHGDGTLSVSDSAALVMNPTIGDQFSYSDIGSHTGATGTLLVSSGARITGDSQLFVGAAGYGSLDLTGGGYIFSDGLVGSADAGLGQDPTGLGVGTIDDAIWESEQSFFVGYDGSGTLTVQHGATLDVDSGFLRLARDLGSVGTLSYNDGDLNAANAVLTVGPDVVSSTYTSATGGAGTMLFDDSSGDVSGVILAGLATGSGTLNLPVAANLVVENSLTTGAGVSVLAVRADSDIRVSGSIEIGGGGGSAYASLTDNGKIYEQSTIAGNGLTIAGLGTLAIDPTSTLYLSQAATLEGGTISALGNDTLPIRLDISGGTKASPSAITGTPGADMVLTNGITFTTGVSAALLLEPAFDTSNVISNFASGDLLDVQITPTVFNAASYDIATSQLLLSVTGDAPVVLNLANNGYTANSFSVFADGAGGTDVVLGPPCYVTGTNILTDRGEVPVEGLRIGDRLITRTGAARPLRWIGRRAYAARFVAANPQLWPIRIAAGALAEQIPARDLFVSPCHAIYFEHVLVPAGALVNGTTIARVQPMTDLGYYHLELTTHDVIFAEAAPAETYLDLANRHMFHNAAEYAALPPNTDAHSLREYAPRHEHGPEVAAIRSCLAARASAIGCHAEKWYELRLDEPGRTRAELPAATSVLNLRSQTAYAPGDHRPLGALLHGVRLDGVPLPLTDPALLRGFHEVERHGDQVVRWTNGDALLVIVPAAFARCVEIDIAALPHQRRVA